MVVFHQGHFEINGDASIYPTDIEFYFHSEVETDPEWMKDYGMYHIGNKASFPYFPPCSIFPHRSGIDIRFEDELKQFRASFLIRSYHYEYPGPNGTGDSKLPTQLWEDMLGYCSFNRAEGLSIKWVDDTHDSSNVAMPKRQERYNLCKYSDINKPVIEVPGNMKGRKDRVQDNRKRRFIK